MIKLGSIDIESQVKYIDLEHNSTVNPFLLYKLDQVHFSDMLIQNNTVFFDHGEDVYLTISAQGMHLPTNIYKYMQDTFFASLC